MTLFGATELGANSNKMISRRGSSPVEMVSRKAEGVDAKQKGRGIGGRRSRETPGTLKEVVE